MAGYKAHILGATLFALAAVGSLIVLSPFIAPAGLQLSSTSLLKSLFLLGICILGALWPDIDTKSKSQKLFYLVFLAIDTYLIFTEHLSAAALLGYVAMLPIISPHRGWIHSKQAAVIFCLPIVVFPMLLRREITFIGLPYFAAALTGYFSHLVLDGKW